MQTPDDFVKVNLRVGPFGNQTEAYMWELEFARAFLDERNFEAPLSRAEARTIRGRLVHAMTGHRQAELGAAPPGKNPLRPQVHLIVHQGIPESPDEKIGILPDINTKKVSARDAARSLERFITLYKQKAA